MYWPSGGNANQQTHLLIVFHVINCRVKAKQHGTGAGSLQYRHITTLLCALGAGK